ncbi:MAG: reverse transcriptase family protein [Candidatus Binatia bacterium]
MAPLAPLFEFRVHPTRASLEAPLGRDSSALEALAARCDEGSAYRAGVVMIRGKLRQLAVPKPELDAVQRRINQILYPVDLSLGPAPHGYVARRSTLTNARPHTGARFLQKFDIKDFFSNIPTARIESTLGGLGFGSEAASTLSRLTSCQGSLPLGARTSPRISNMVLIDLDDQMEALASELDLIYTRYADDLTFSALDPFDVSASVMDAITDAGFELNAAKTKRFKHGQPMFVTGLSVADSKFPRVRKRLKAQLRQEFYFIEKFGLEGHAAAVGESPSWTASRLTGEYHYCRTVEPDFADGLARNYPAARATIVPEHEDSRVERAQRHRRAFLSEVSNAPSKGLPYYVPSVPLLDR